MVRLQTPLKESDIRDLNVGDIVLLSGNVVTARDAAHKFMVEEKPNFIREYLKDSVIYHCGPVVRKDEEGYHFISAGPTTSGREEPYEATVIKEYSVRGVIGKGGMGQKTSDGLKEVGAVYLSAVGGAGSLIAEKVVKVLDVFKLEEFGTPEAFWVVEVKDLPLVVTMDSKGKSIHKDVLENSKKKYEEVLESI